MTPWLETRYTDIVSKPFLLCYSKGFIGLLEITIHIYFKLKARLTLVQSYIHKHVPGRKNKERNKESIASFIEVCEYYWISCHLAVTLIKGQSMSTLEETSKLALLKIK